MSLRRLLLTAVLVCFAMIPLVRADEISPAEKAKIEALISHLETLQQAKFVRNGTEYDAKAAATFLRRKWQSNARDIKTASGFIANVATKSSTSGKPYVIRINGVETACAEYLNAQLKKLETTAGKR